MNDLETIQAIQTLLGVTADGKFGPKSRAALDDVAASAGMLAMGFTPKESPPSGGLLVGDGTWPWRAFVDGSDIVVTSARATCFGGFDDPQDNGETASGISTKSGIAACSLPMDGKMFHGLSPAEHAALDGSPIPRVPWETQVKVTHKGQTFSFPVIDLGPGKRTGNALDLTKAAARMFDPKATETNFEAVVDYRIVGGAQFLA